MHFISEVKLCDICMHGAGAERIFLCGNGEKNVKALPAVDGKDGDSDYIQQRV